jgi:uncharacterized SAM-binding protein YcdF (DUF218 family)
MRTLEKFDLVVLLCADALNEREGFDEISPVNGAFVYLGGQVRMDAAVDFAPNVSTYIVIGGKHKGGKYKKIEDMKNFLEKRFNEINLISERPKIVRLYSKADTTGNLWGLKRALRDAGKLEWIRDKKIGIFTNFYHIPRAMRFAKDIFSDVRASFVPISAEAVLDRTEATYSHYPRAFLRRIVNEQNGLRAWERGEYQDKEGNRVQEWREDLWDFECLDKEILRQL